MRESKECLECGGIYFRPEYSTNTQWEARRYCSAVCAGKAGARALHQKEKVLAEAIQPIEPEVPQRKPEPFKQRTFPGKPLDDEQVRQANRLAEEERLPIMRDLRIVRVGPNPRLITCEYFELRERRTCTVLVGPLQKKFVRGMRFKMAEPVEEAEFRRPWKYTGPAPRHRGRW